MNGVTWSGNCWCHPSSSNVITFFGHHHHFHSLRFSKWRLFIVLINSLPKLFLKFSLGCHPWMVSPRAVCLPPPLTPSDILSLAASCVCPCVSGPMLEVCQHNILQNVCGNFTEFTAYVQLGTKINSLNFKVRKFTVQVRLPMVRNCLLKNAPFRQRHIGQQLVIENHRIRFWRHSTLTFDRGSCFSIFRWRYFDPIPYGDVGSVLSACSKCWNWWQRTGFVLLFTFAD